MMSYGEREVCDPKWDGVSDFVLERATKDTFFMNSSIKL